MRAVYLPDLTTETYLDIYLEKHWITGEISLSAIWHRNKDKIFKESVKFLVCNPCGYAAPPGYRAAHNFAANKNF